MSVFSMHMNANTSCSLMGPGWEIAHIPDIKTNGEVRLWTLGESSRIIDPSFAESETWLTEGYD